MKTPPIPSTIHTRTGSAIGGLILVALTVLSGQPAIGQNGQSGEDMLAPIRQSMALYNAARQERQNLQSTLRPEGVQSSTLLKHSMTGYLFGEQFDQMTLLLKQQMDLAMVHQSIVRQGGTPPHADFRERTYGTLREYSAHLLRAANEEDLLRGPARQLSPQSDQAIDRAAAVAEHTHRYAQGEVDRIAANQGAEAAWQFEAKSPNGRQMRQFYDSVYGHVPKVSCTEGGKRTIGDVAVWAPTCFVLHQKALQLTDWVYGVMAMEEHMAALSPNAPFRDRHQKSLDEAYQRLLASIGWLDGTWQATRGEASTFGPACGDAIEEFRELTVEISDFCRSKGYAIDAEGNFTTSADPIGTPTIEPSKPTTSGTSTIKPAKPTTSLSSPDGGVTFSITPSGDGVEAREADGNVVWRIEVSKKPATGLEMRGDRLLVHPSREVFDTATGELVEILPETAAAAVGEGEGFINDGPWKLYLDSSRLYHTGNDAREQHNVAAQFPEIVAQLQAQARYTVRLLVGRCARSNELPTAAKS